MTIKVLLENSTLTPDLACEHGLSLYIEANGRKILFDTGASGLFAENAEKMDVDLAAVDAAVISHAHGDHGGGLKTFLQKNQTAKVYVQQTIFDPYFSLRPSGEMAQIGLDASLADTGRFVFCPDRYVLGPGLELFSGVKGKDLTPSGNANLFKPSGDGFLPDDFSHEQNLAVTEGEKTVLISGCSHCGIVNILAHFQSLFGAMPNVVLGGFHLYSPSRKESESPEKVRAIGEYLKKTKSKYYTGHCTGAPAYQQLKEMLGDALAPISTGGIIRI